MKYIFYTPIVLFMAFLLNGCASQGLLSDSFDADTLRVKNAFESIDQENPRFLVYADNQAGRRVIEKFYRIENWKTWKQLLFPFYQVYHIGNGLVGGINYLRHKTDYGKETRLMMRDVIYREAKATNADFIFNIGDICYADGRYPDDWKGFLKENKWEHPLLNEIPYLTAIGNHERANDDKYGYKNYESVFEYPRFYTVEFEDAVLIVVDSNFIVDQDDLIGNGTQDELFEHYFVSNSGEDSWLEKQLANAEEKFIIIAMHHPPVTFGHHYSDWYNTKKANNLLDKRKSLLNLFTKYGVDVVLSGHEHYYQHNILNYENDQKIHFIISSGGGTPIRRAPGENTKQEKLDSYKESGFDIESIIQSQVYHLTDVSINSNRLKLDTCEVMSTDSHIELIDSFSVLKN